MSALSEAEAKLTKTQRELLDILRSGHGYQHTGFAGFNARKFRSKTADTLVEVGLAHWDTRSTGYHSHLDWWLFLGGETREGYTGYENAERIRAEELD